MKTYTSEYADMTVARLTRRAVSALESIVEDAQRAKKELEQGHLPTLLGTIASNAATITSTCTALEFLHEVQKLEAAGKKEP